MAALDLREPLSLLDLVFVVVVVILFFFCGLHMALLPLKETHI